MCAQQIFLFHFISIEYFCVSLSLSLSGSVARSTHFRRDDFPGRKGFSAIILRPSFKRSQACVRVIIAHTHTRTHVSVRLFWKYLVGCHWNTQKYIIYNMRKTFTDHVLFINGRIVRFVCCLISSVLAATLSMGPVHCLRLSHVRARVCVRVLRHINAYIYHRKRRASSIYTRSIDGNNKFKWWWCVEQSVFSVFSQSHMCERLARRTHTHTLIILYIIYNLIYCAKWECK